MRALSSLLAVGLLFVLASCADPAVQQQIDARNQSIAAEPRGDYFIARRFYIGKTQFWGYIRRPGQSWDASKLVMINESQKLAPDRLPEEPVAGNPGHGFDHNREYRFTGYFTGQKVYDPNSDLFLPEFMLTGYQVMRDSGGWLFHPKENYDGKHLLRFENVQ